MEDTSDSNRMLPSVEWRDSAILRLVGLILRHYLEATVDPEPNKLEPKWLQCLKDNTVIF